MMVTLKETRGKDDKEIKNGAYYRCFGNLKVARLLSRIQSLIIKNGYELERLFEELTKDKQIEDLDGFLSVQIQPKGIWIALKKAVKQSDILEGHGIEPDFIIFERGNDYQNCYIVELKDGHEFDTKSSSKEHQNLHDFLSRNAIALQYFHSYCKICGFNATSKEEIRKGFKNKIDINQAMTGKELCDLIGLDYEEIVKKRAEDRVKNLESFIEEIANIPEIESELKDRLK